MRAMAMRVVHLAAPLAKWQGETRGEHIWPGNYVTNNAVSIVGGRQTTNSSAARRLIVRTRRRHCNLGKNRE